MTLQIFRGPTNSSTQVQLNLPEMCPNNVEIASMCMIHRKVSIPVCLLIQYPCTHIFAGWDERSLTLTVSLKRIKALLLNQYKCSLRPPKMHCPKGVSISKERYVTSCIRTREQPGYIQMVSISSCTNAAKKIAFI